VAAISTASGYDWAYTKNGRIENRGVEIVLNARPVHRRGFGWEMSFSAAKNHNEVLDLGPGVQSIQIDASTTFTTYIHHEVGHPASVIKGTPFVRDAAGRIVFGPDGLPEKGPFGVLGNGVHDLTAGWTNRLRFGAFSLSFLIDLKTGAELYSATNAMAYIFGRHKNTLQGRADGVAGLGVTPDGQPNAVRFGPENLISYYGFYTFNISEEFVYDASFAKLRQAQLTWQLPKSWQKRLGARGLEVSLVGRNLLLLYSAVPNVDPESTYNNSNAQGLELFGVPQTRSFGFDVRARW
jgi:hypothetical protein